MGKITDFMDDVADALVEQLVQWGAAKGVQLLDRESKVLKLMHLCRLGELRNDFSSIYSHALLEYAADAGNPEWVRLFSTAADADYWTEAWIKEDLEAIARLCRLELRLNPRYAPLAAVQPGDNSLLTELRRFYEVYEQMAINASTPYQIRQYNRLTAISLKYFEEAERKSFPWQAIRYMESLRDDFREKYLDNHHYIPLHGETRTAKIQAATPKPGKDKRSRRADVLETGVMLELPEPPDMEIRGAGYRRLKTEECFDCTVYRPLDNYIRLWLEDNESPLLVIVGEYGTGKTTFLRHVAHQLALQRLEQGSENAMADPHRRLPLFFPLREFEKNIESFIINRFNHVGIEDINYSSFLKRLQNNEFLLLLDGFDEMSQQIDSDEKARNFQKIRQMLEKGGNGKIILTVREEFFTSAEDMDWVFKDGDKNHYRFVRLLPFDDEQIQAYLGSHTADPGYYWEQIKTIFDLHDLAKRPVLLQLMVDYLPGVIAAKGKYERINASDLYQQCIEDEMGRKSGELEFIVPNKHRLAILQKLAVWLFMNDSLTFDLRLLKEELNLKQYFYVEQAWEFEKRLNEFLTFTFLLREGDNRFRISHKSFRDYLTAGAFLAEIKSGQGELFGRKLTTKEINHFITEQEPDKGVLLRWLQASRDLPEERLWQGSNAANVLLKMDKSALRGLALSGCRLSHVDFSGCDLTDTDLTGANLSDGKMNITFLKSCFRDADVARSVLWFIGAGLTDITLLRELKNVTVLYLWDNKITDLAPLNPMTALTELSISNNQVTDLAPLTPLTALTELSISNNQVTDLAPLTPLTALTTLDIRNNQVTDLAPLTPLTALTWLNISNNQVTDLAPLTPLTALTWLNISNNQVTDLAPLLNITQLKDLVLDKTQYQQLETFVEILRKNNPGLSINIVEGPAIHKIPKISPPKNSAPDYPFDELESAVTQPTPLRQKLPLGAQHFPHIIEENFLYVDKTRFITQMIQSGLTYVFLSRPRRFGKSLLISTMKEVFLGRRELFKNLYIYDKIDWQTFPVIFFDFSFISAGPGDSVSDSLAREVDRYATENDLPIAAGTPKEKFRDLIQSLSIKENKKVVILIDEYDKFILDFIDNDDVKKRNRSELRSFLSVLKGLNQYIRFLFITGVSKFSQVSIFSDLNNLEDLTFNRDYAAVAGYTREELIKHFQGYILEFAQKKKYPPKKLLEIIRRWYNGYSWDGVTKVYNPYSILKLFNNFEFRDHWYATGTSDFLNLFIRDRQIDIRELDDIHISRSSLENMDLEQLKLIPLLFQSGYLTIILRTEHDIQKEILYLGYPNKDVRYSFLNYLLHSVSPESPRSVDKLFKALTEDRIDDAFNYMKSVFAGIPFNDFLRSHEAYYHSVINVIFIMLLDRADAEIQTNRGRIDLVFESKNQIYIFEFKMENVQEALTQILDRKYYEKYLIKEMPIKLVAVSFSAEDRNIKEWLVRDLGEVQKKPLAPLSRE